MSRDVALNNARARAGRIRQGIHGYLSTLGEIAAAWRDDDWRTLGYTDWVAYVDGEYGAERLRLSPEYRQKAVVELRLAGMSTRAIGSALGISHTEARRTIERASPAGTNVPPGIDERNDAVAYPAVPRPAPAVAPEPAPEPELEPVREPEPSPLVEAMKAAIEETAGRARAGRAVQKMLDDDPDVQAAEFMRRFTGAVARAGHIYEFPPERVARHADELVIESLEHHSQLLTAFVAEVRKHRPSRLRLVKEA